MHATLFPYPLPMHPTRRHSLAPPPHQHHSLCHHLHRLHPYLLCCTTNTNPSTKRRALRIPIPPIQLSMKKEYQPLFSATLPTIKTLDSSPTRLLPLPCLNYLSPCLRSCNSNPLSRAFGVHASGHGGRSTSCTFWSISTKTATSITR